MESVNLSSKIFLTLLVSLAFSSVKGQYQINSALVRNEFKCTGSNYEHLSASSLEKSGNMVEIKWTIVNDFKEGHFALYKSGGHVGPFVLLDYILCPKNLPRNIPIQFFYNDSSYNLEHNIYYIVKIEKNSLVIPIEERIALNSIAFFEIEEQATPDERIVTKVYASTQFFTQEPEPYLK